MQLLATHGGLYTYELVITCSKTKQKEYIVNNTYVLNNAQKYI